MIPRIFRRAHHARVAALTVALPLLIGDPPLTHSAVSSPIHPAVRQQDPMASRSRGNPAAAVTVYEMADFQCPACRQFFETTLPDVEADYIRTGKVRWVFVNLPLPQTHANAIAAAELAMCAAQQGRFWAMHDLLYRHQIEWADLADPGVYFCALVTDSARVRKDRLAACLATHATSPEITADADRARRSGAQSTPSFYIEGGLLVGAWPPADFRHVLDSIYLVKTASAPARAR